MTPWPSPNAPTSPRLPRLWRVGLWLALLLLGLVGGAQAQSLESALSPGKVIQGHVKWEDDCKSCHVRFDKTAQDRVCMDCHKDIAADLRGKLGYHGRIKPQACRNCHTDHKGRDARIAEFDKQRFDHALTDYALRGKHTSTDCGKCHTSGKKYREAATECNACHRKDDVHKGGLGAQCADCHTEQSWKEAKFDHDKTAFALTGKHATAGCADCHKNKANYKDTPRTCYGCHRKDDDSTKGHKGLFGERCDSCHGSKGWKPSSFNHDIDTKYALRGKHKATRCVDCHTGSTSVYKQKTSQECASCHLKDDKHKGTLGKDCGACHGERDWKEKAKFDHNRSDFPLLGKHAEIKCEACHKSTLFKEAPKTCMACHEKDDQHAGTLGTACESCHAERSWKDTRGRFDHDKTQFKLRNAHAAATLQCQSCHKDLKSFRKTPQDCYSCHVKDDRHAGQQGRDCAACHDDKPGWKVPGFNHSRTRFALVGRHTTTACKDCHRTPRFKDAPRECVGCHLKDDKHQRVFGEACASCHNARAWSVWDFDHNRRSKYKLDGAHRQTACDSCHTRPAPAGKPIAPLESNCLACHRKDDVHDGGFGMVCEQCHNTTNWKQISNRGSRTGSNHRGDDTLSPTGRNNLLLAALLGQASHWARSAAQPPAHGSAP